MWLRKHTKNPSYNFKTIVIMKKFLFSALALAIAATGAWAIKAKIDTTTKAQKQVVVADKELGTTTITTLRAIGAKEAPEGAVTVPYFNTFDTEEETGQLSLYDANNDGKTWGLASVSGGGYRYHSPRLLRTSHGGCLCGNDPLRRGRGGRSPCGNPG